MADLSLTDAQGLAASLVTMGHPYSQAAINATALDLTHWCKGCEIGDHIWIPKEQAEAIVKEARLTWEDGWPEKGGTLRLLGLFRQKFEPWKLGPERQTLDTKKWERQYGPPDPAFARNLLKPLTDREHVSDRQAVLWQAIRDSIYYTETPMGRAELARTDDKSERIEAFKFWKEAAKRNQRDHAGEVVAFRVELAQHNWEELMTFDWAKAKEGTGEEVVEPSPVLIRDGKMLATGEV